MAERDREFRFPQISYIDYKQIEIDRTLLNLFPRLKFDGYMGRVIRRESQLTIDTFLEEFIEDAKDFFIGFAEHKDIVYKWLETDLLDLVNRGHPTKQAVVSPRPLHGNTYKFRNAHHGRDYNSAEQWEIDGALDTRQRANKKWKKLLADYQPPVLDPAVDAALLEFIKQRKSQHGYGARVVR